MPTVFISQRSQFSLLLSKALVSVIAVLTLVMLLDAKPSAIKTGSKPVLPLSDQAIELNPPGRIPQAQYSPEQILPLIFEDTRPDLALVTADTVANDDTLQSSIGLPNTNPTPDDTFARQQWSLHNNPTITGSSGLFGSYDYLSNGHNVVVAVVDSGVILQHEDLNFLPGYDFIHNPLVGNDGDGRDHDPGDPGDWVDNDDIDQQTVSEGCAIAASKWHGTAISGIIGATPYNATGIAGGSPSVSILPVRVTGKCGGYVSDLIDGIRWAAGLKVNGVANNQYPARVINLSVGFPGTCSNALQQAINDAADAGAILVTAATNSGADLDNNPYSPASCSNVLTVAATDRKGAITSYTALGASVFISAPGGTASDGILTTQNDGHDLPLPGNYYGYQFGTSIAAAHVSSAVANLLAYNPALSQPEVRRVLSDSASSMDLDSKCGGNQCGAGRLNAVAAMQLLVANNVTDDAPDNETTTAVTTEPDNTAPVQLAAVQDTETAIESVITATASNDVMAGSIDWLNFLMLSLLLLISRACKYRI